LNSSYHPGRLQEHEKKFSRDDPRAAYDIAFLLLLFLPPHSIPPALSPADLLSMGSLPILMAGLPLSPFCRFVPTTLAAIACQRMIRSEYPATAFQQTTPAPWSARTALFWRTYSFSLILEMS
jgi:hypothetical protein